MGQAERVYRLLIGDPRYQAILTIALVTMFTFYGFGYLIGVVEMNHGDIISRIIKIGLIYLFVGETGWQWFNDIVVKFFKESTDYLAFMMASSFDNSPELMNAITDGNYYDKSVLFGSVDKVFELFFSTAVRKKVSALLFASIFGWAYLFIIYSSFILYVYAVANAVLLYLTAQVFISILFVLGPIFFVFTLFSQTKEMFDNWLKQLIGFSLQQIFLLTTLAFFNMLMYEVLKMSLGYKICWDEVWTINIITRITLLSFWTIASLPPRTNAHSEVGNIGNPEGIPSLFTILFIWVIASLMHKFITFMTNLASSISGGLSASSLGKGVADFAAAAQKGAGQWAGKLADTAGFNPVRSLDKALFDSGKLAEEARAKQKKQNSMDLNNKSSMAKAGDKAVSQYKIDNAKELMTMSQAEQKKRLNEVSDKAMTSKGKALGLNDDQIKSLKSDTGLKYTGSNVFGAGIQAIRQGARTGGSLSTSLKDRNSEKDIQQFSHSEGQKALKNMSKDERAEFIKHAKEGDVSVGKSALNRKAEILATPFKAIGNAASSALKIVHDKEYNEAAKELEKTGAIDKHSVKIPFTNKKINLGAFRNSRQKDLINEKLKNNKEAQKVNPDTHKYAVAELEREANSLEKDEKISESDDGIMSKALGKTANALGRGLRLGNYAAEAKKNSADNKAKVQQKNIEDNDRNMDELSEARDDAMNEVEEAQSELEKVPGYDEMSKLAEEVSNNPNASRGQKAKLARLEKNVYGTEQGLNLKKAQMAVHGIDDEMNNVKIRQEKVGGTKNNSNNSSDTEA
jgi:type IV secretory pathway VirB6-like protein